MKVLCVQGDDQELEEVHLHDAHDRARNHVYQRQGRYLGGCVAGVPTAPEAQLFQHDEGTRLQGGEKAGFGAARRAPDEDGSFDPARQEAATEESPANLAELRCPRVLPSLTGGGGKGKGDSAAGGDRRGRGLKRHRGQGRGRLHAVLMNTFCSPQIRSIFFSFVTAQSPEQEEQASTC